MSGPKITGKSQLGTLKVSFFWLYYATIYCSGTWRKMTGASLPLNFYWHTKEYLWPCRIFQGYISVENDLNDGLVYDLTSNEEAK